MKIELLYFKGCPSWRQAEDNLKAALTELRLSGSIERVRVESKEEAVRRRFPGSPTIRIDGKDIEAGADEGNAFSLACRIYLEGDKFRGWPSVRRIREVLQKAGG